MGGIDNINTISESEVTKQNEKQYEQLDALPEVQEATISQGLEAVESIEAHRFVLADMQQEIRENMSGGSIESLDPPDFEGGPTLDRVPGFSADEFQSLEDFITDLDDSKEARKIWLELRRGDYKALKNFLFFVDQQFGFQFLMMDEVDPNSDVQPNGYDKKVNFYDTYTQLMTKLLGSAAVKSVAELEASAQSDMDSFVKYQYPAIADAENSEDQYIQFFDIMGKYAQEVRYTSDAGSERGYQISSSSESAFSTLQKQIQQTEEVSDASETISVGPLDISKEVDALKTLIKEAPSGSAVADAVSRFRFLRSLDVFEAVVKSDKTVDEKHQALRTLSKKLHYVTDIDVTLTDGTTKAKDFLEKTLINLASQDEVIADSGLSRDIDNFLDDLTYETHAYGLTMTVEDGVNHAEISRSAEQVAKGNRIEYLNYLDYTENIKKLDAETPSEQAVIDQIGEYFVGSELDLSRLSYIDTQSAERLVDAINQNPDIESVTINAMLLQDRMGDDALIDVLSTLKHVQKEMTVIVGRDSLGYQGVGFTQPILSVLGSSDSSLTKLTVLADGLGAEYDLTTLASFPGSLSLPRLIANPLDDASTKSFIKTWADTHQDQSLDFGFIATSNTLPEAIDENGKKGQTYILSRLQDLQVDGGSPLSYTQANVLLPSQKVIPEDLLAIGDRETKTAVDVGERKAKKKRRIESDAGSYNFASMDIDTQKARDIRTYFRGNDLAIQKPSEDSDLLEIAQSKNLTSLRLIGGVPSADTLATMADEGYIDTLALEGVDTAKLATDDYANALDEYESLEIVSTTTTKLTSEQRSSLMRFDGDVVIDQPLSIDIEALGKVLEKHQPRSLVLKHRTDMIVKDDEGNDVVLTADDYYKARDSYAVGKKDTKGYDLVDFFRVLEDNNVDIDFADGASQYPALLYEQMNK